MLIWLWRAIVGKIDFEKIKTEEFKTLVSSFIPKLSDEQKKMLLEAAVAGAVQGAVNK